MYLLNYAWIVPIVFLAIYILIKRLGGKQVVTLGLLILIVGMYAGGATLVLKEALKVLHNAEINLEDSW